MATPFDFPRSTSQRRAYRACGYRYYQQYGLGWKSLARKGTYAFGDTMEALAHLITSGAVATPLEAEQLFLARWVDFEKDPALTWTSRGPWKTLRERGRALAAVMATELPKRIQPGALVNEKLVVELQPGLKETAIPDHYGIVDHLPTVLDYKTSDREYRETSAEIDEQLTDYQIAEETLGRPVAQVGLCILIYSASPKIQWLMSPRRDKEEVARFVTSAAQVDSLIRQEVFARNDRSCYVMGECAFTPLCFGSQRERIEKELVRTKQGTSDLITTLEEEGSDGE